MNDFSELTEIAPLQREPIEGIRISVSEEARPSLQFNNVPPDLRSAQSPFQNLIKGYKAFAA